MRRVFVFLAILGLLAFMPEAGQSAQKGEIFLAKVAPKYVKGIRLDDDRFREFRKKETTIFKPGDPIFALVSYYHNSEQWIEFEWCKPLRNTCALRYVYGHQPRYEGGPKYFAWSEPGKIRQGLLDPLLGSEFAGTWIVTVTLDGKKFKQMEFIIK